MESVFFLKEIWMTHVLSYLEIKDLANLRRSSRWFKEIVDSSLHWKQWYPSDKLKQKETIKTFNRIYGIYFKNRLDDLPSMIIPNLISLKVIDFSHFGQTFNLIELLSLLPSSIEKLIFNQWSSLFTQKELIEFVTRIQKHIVLEFYETTKEGQRFYLNLIYYCSFKGYSQLLELLLKRETISSEVINKGFGIQEATALFIACKHMYPKLVKLLLQYGANPLLGRSKNIDGMTCFQLAQQNKFKDQEIYELVLQYSKFSSRLQ